MRRSAVRSASPSLLAGRIFDDRNNPMTPTHASKKGVRYRYYVSHALLQGQANKAGSVTRISAPDVEALIANRLRANSNDGASDREIIENHLDRAIVGKDHIAITARSGAPPDAANNQNDGPDDLGSLHADLALAEGNLTYAIGRPGDRRSHAIGATHSDRTLKSLGRHARQRSGNEHWDDRETGEPGRAARSVPDAARLSLPAHHRGDRRGSSPCRSHRHSARSQPAGNLGGSGRAARVRLIHKPPARASSPQPARLARTRQPGRGSRCNCGTSLRGTRTGLGRSPWANSGDWKFEVRDRAANWASGDPFQAVSNLRAREPRRMRPSPPAMAKSPNYGNAWLGREEHPSGPMKRWEMLELPGTQGVDWGTVMRH